MKFSAFRKPLWLTIFISTLFLALGITSAQVLSVVTDPELGDRLVLDGAALYVFLPDAQAASTCVDACAENWPPVIVTDTPINLSEGVDDELGGTSDRDSGALQFTYNGWPLYTFAADGDTGLATGQGLGGNWFVIAPDGSLIGVEASGQAEEAVEVSMSQEEYDALYRDGIRSYRSVCAACHGRDGNEVLSSHVLLLEENDNLADAADVIRQIIHGNGYMPALGGALNDRQVAAVATYIRNSWGNDYGPVREEDIAQYR